MRAKRPVDAVVVGLSATGLSVVRALARAGLRVVGLDRRPWEVGHLSRHCRSVREMSVEAVARLAAGRRVPLFAGGDPELAWVLEHARALSSHVLLPPSYLNGVAAGVLDKRRYYARCLDLGVPLPRTWIPDTDHDLRTIAGQARFPVIAKPARGAADWVPRSGKVVLCQTPGEVLALDPRRVVVQEVLGDGPDGLMVCAFHRSESGEVGATVVARKVRQWPARFGSGARLVVEDHPEVRARSGALAERLGLTGICAMEWKQGPSGLVHIETNPRAALWFSLADSVVVEAFNALTGQHLRVPPAPPLGMDWQYVVRDVAAAGARALPLAGRRALLSLDDPLPGLYSVPYSLILTLRRRLGRR